MEQVHLHNWPAVLMYAEMRQVSCVPTWVMPSHVDAFEAPGPTGG